jgi:hypothetical protein
LIGTRRTVEIVRLGSEVTGGAPPRKLLADSPCPRTVLPELFVRLLDRNDLASRNEVRLETNSSVADRLLGAKAIKTKLALEHAWLVLRKSADGRWFESIAAHQTQPLTWVFAGILVTVPHQFARERRDFLRL